MALPHYGFSFPDAGPPTVERVLGYARRAEESGFDSVWVSDHLFLDLARYGGPAERYATPEALTMLTAIAAGTRRVRLGSLVLCAAFRPAALTALAGTGIHQLSGGRFDLGMGAGWYEAEFEAAGVPFGTAGERIAHLRATTGMVRELLERGGMPAPGLEVLPWSAPAKDRPAVWVGGKGGPKVARIVAEHADGWNVVWRMTPEDYRARLRTLHEACAEAGRDPATVRLSVGLYTLLGSDDRDLARRFEAMQAWAPGRMIDGLSLSAYADGALAGTPRQVAAHIEAFGALGVEEVILGFGALPFSLPDDEQLDLAGELLAEVR